MEFWHLIGRGVDKRDIVLDDKDRVRFIHDMYVFNDLNPTPNYVLNGRHEALRTRDLLVDIHSFCLMNNHYHLLVSERIEGGISLFMKKLNMGYTKYFNEKYERSGALWQGKYRKVLIERDAHFLYIPFYIHLNPLDYTHSRWRRGEVTESSKALESLSKYRWSSHLDYLGIKNFPSLIHMDILKPILGERRKYENAISTMIQDPDRVIGNELLEYRN
ncbi:MAG: transposase [Candidatus Kaiserbacteria bacterium]|nr:transposase [Candidatus Kaiserbacteria bacterium]